MFIWRPLDYCYLLKFMISLFGAGVQLCGLRPLSPWQWEEGHYWRGGGGRGGPSGAHAGSWLQGRHSASLRRQHSRNAAQTSPTLYLRHSHRIFCWRYVPCVMESWEWKWENSRTGVCVH
jgi:hypothetical protein